MIGREKDGNIRHLQDAKQVGDVAAGIVGELGVRLGISAQKYAPHADKRPGVCAVGIAVDDGADPPGQIALFAQIWPGGTGWNCGGGCNQDGATCWDGIGIQRKMWLKVPTGDRFGRDVCGQPNSPVVQSSVNYLRILAEVEHPRCLFLCPHCKHAVVWDVAVGNRHSAGDCRSCFRRDYFPEWIRAFPVQGSQG
jgi:hypothetical protein